MRPAVSSSTAQTTGTGARSEGGIESEGDGEEEEEEEVMPTDYTDYTEGAGGKGGKGMPHAEDVEDAETRRARGDVGDEGGRGGRGGREGEEECLTTKYTKGGGRGPEKLPTDHAKGRERRKRESEVLPTEHTEYTEKSKRGIGRVAGTRDGRRRTITRTRNDFFWGRDGRAAGAEMAGREPLSRGAGDGGK